ncbi:hypothetical protein HK096_008037 [Nowakowskiella sp. JEL0078]|nr:hypothetical protein HK096_008037 [Nowakowskiella sp. JEL0078]
MEFNFPTELKIQIIQSLEPLQKYILFTNLRFKKGQSLCLGDIPQLSVREASEKGIIPLLDIWKQFNFANLQKNSEAGLIHASFGNHIDVLLWWDRSGVDLKLSNDGYSIKYQNMLDYVSGNGYIDVLNWWFAKRKDFRWKLKWNPRAINDASANGHVDVLKAWKIESDLRGMEFLYYTDAMDKTSLVAVLNWWKDSGLEMKWTSFAMNKASMNGHIHILNWWKESGLEMKWTSFAMDNASMYGHIHILNWWRESGLELLWSIHAMDYASINGCVEALEWWKESGLEMKWTNFAMDYASMNGHIHILNWWKESGLELKWSSKALDLSSMNHQSLTWWNESGLELKWTVRAKIKKALENLQT